MDRWMRRMVRSCLPSLTQSNPKQANSLRSARKQRWMRRMVRSSRRRKQNLTN
jgi:hypothetical protein